ncbi:MAG TPA: hypothetical protein VFL31_06635 [Nitrospiraceae bacterium]|nr:hypothetical protein [Nitrospiraceae bacterium]
MQLGNLANLLSYGAIGLGLALAILAYLLLRTEQRVARPRKSIITAIYVFMCFSLVLSGAGFASEYLRSDAATLPEMRKELAEKTKTLTNLSSSRQVLDALVDVKDGKIERLKQLDPSNPSYVPLVQEIQRDLEVIDQSIRKALGG